MGGGKGWDLHVKVEPAKEEKKKRKDGDEGGGGDSTWLIVVVVLGLLLLLLAYGHGGSGRLWDGGGSGCSGAEHPGYSCAGGDHHHRWDGSGHDGEDHNAGRP